MGGITAIDYWRLQICSPAACIEKLFQPPWVKMINSVQIELVIQRIAEAFAAKPSVFICPPPQSNVFMYYGLSNFYQNHRRYVKSRDDSQLNGDQSALTV